jgi:hypothetical protein
MTSAALALSPQRLASRGPYRSGRGRGKEGTWSRPSVRDVQALEVQLPVTSSLDERFRGYREGVRWETRVGDTLCFRLHRLNARRQPASQGSYHPRRRGLSFLKVETNRFIIHRSLRC